jgi:hypothetical protein
MKEISDKDLQTAIDSANAGGGFSVRAYGPRAGELAKDAYMVGIPGYGQDYSPKVDLGQARGFVQTRQGILSRNDHFLGGWRGSNPVRTSLDVSRSYSPLGGKRAEVSARLTAARGNQEEIGKVDVESQYAGGVPNPNYNPAVPQSMRELTAADRSWAFEPVRRRLSREEAATRPRPRLSRKSYGRPKPA